MKPAIIAAACLFAQGPAPGCLAGSFSIAPAVESPRAPEPASLACAGLERTQTNQDEEAPDAGIDKTPDDDGSSDNNETSPSPDSQDDDEHSNVAPPDEGHDPPGCIFRNEPLDLLV